MADMSTLSTLSSKHTHDSHKNLSPAIVRPTNKRRIQSTISLVIFSEQIANELWSNFSRLIRTLCAKRYTYVHTCIQTWEQEQKRGSKLRVKYKTSRQISTLAIYSATTFSAVNARTVQLSSSCFGNHIKFNIVWNNKWTYNII